MKDMHGNDVKVGFFVEQQKDGWVVNYYHYGRKIANDRPPQASQAEAEDLWRRLDARAKGARLQAVARHIDDE